MVSRSRKTISGREKADQFLFPRAVTPEPPEFFPRHQAENLRRRLPPLGMKRPVLQVIIAVFPQSSGCPGTNPVNQLQIIED